MVDPPVLLRRARAMRREPTEAERTLWRLLRSRQLDGLKFRRQVPIGPYIADFLCFEPRLVVECDGAQHADHAYDAERDAWFTAQGYRVFRFTNQTVLQEIEASTPSRSDLYELVSRHHWHH